MAKGKVGVIGLGYVGLPLAVEFCRAGYDVIGVDIDERRLDSLRRGVSYIGDLDSQEVKEYVENGRLTVSTEFCALKDADGISICVPTPLRKTKEPDISMVADVAESLSQILRPGQLIILESTVYPGATEDLVAPTLEKSGLIAGSDFYLAFSPERVDPGNRSVQLKDIPKLVGGINPESTNLAAAYYKRIFKNVIPMSSAKEAEMAKLLENTFRAVNIGLVNELAMMSHSMGINIWEVIRAAASKPFGFMPFYPGPGWGGHCIPIDPVYLSWKAKMSGLETGFIDHAVQINNQMPQYVVDRVADLLNKEGKPLHDSNVLILGVTYKRNVADVRESPALPIMTSLIHKEAVVKYHDPYVPHLEHDGIVLDSQNLTAELLKSQDCVIITADHSCVDYGFVADHSPLLFDTRDATHGIRRLDSNVHRL